MKIFAIYTKLVLIIKPDWLDEFREQYHQPWDWHVTLKQPCFIEEDKVDRVRRKVDDFFSNLVIEGHKIELTFDELVSDEGKNGAVVMVASRNAQRLMELQKNLCAVLYEYQNYVEPEFQGYEKHFNPHITIGDHLSGERYAESLEYLKNGCWCEGVINEVILSIVNDRSLDEAKRESNMTAYSL